MTKKSKSPERPGGKAKSKVPESKGREKKDASELSSDDLDRVSGGLQSAYAHVKKSPTA